MSEWKQDDPFDVVVLEPEADAFADLAQREVSSPQSSSPDSYAAAGVVVACLHGFDLDERPLVTGLPGLPHEVIAARATVSVLRRDVGSDVVVVLEHGDARRPIVLGVIRPPAPPSARGVHNPEPLVSAQVDDQKLVLTAEREIVLKCGEASITLTRAGKVLIKGTYVLSRSSGYNKIKGAAIDIN